MKFTAEISEYLLPEDIYAIIDAIENPRDKLWVRTAWETGGRVGEVSSLTRPNILRKENALILQNLKQNKRMVTADERAQGILPENKPKTPPDLKRVYLFGTSTLAEDLFRYSRHHKLDNYIFLNKYGDPISRKYIFTMFKRVTEALDIRRIKVNPSTGMKENVPAWPHLIRHCLHPDTRILTSEGIYSAEQLYNMDHQVKILSISLDDFTHAKSDCISKSRHETQYLQIRADGHDIVCSPEHRLFTLKGLELAEVKARDVTPGMPIAGICQAYWVGEEINPDYCRFLGYLVGDGNINAKSDAIKLYDKNLKLITYYCGLMNKLYGGRAKLKGKGNIKATIRKEKRSNSYIASLYSMEVIRELQSLKLDVKQPYRRVPQNIMRASSNSIIHFLAGFFDAEGFTDRLTSSSKDLLLDIQSLLLKLGIMSYLEERNRVITPPSGREINQTQYDIYIKQTDKFFSMVPTFKEGKIHTSKYKYPLQDYVAYLQEKYYGKMKPVLSKYGIKYFKRYTRLWCSHNTAWKIVRIAEDLGEDATDLKRLLLFDVVFYKVKFIKNVGGGISYDFEIANTHNLITNGIISHNSTGMYLFSMTGSLEVVAKHLGHSSISSTECYAGLTDEDHKRILGGIMG